MHRLSFSVPTACLFILASIVFIKFPLTDFDYFWHMETGAWIRRNGWTLPTTDPFSFSSPLYGRPWLVQGWLFDAVQSFVHETFGDRGVRLAFTALIVATWGIVYATARLFIQKPMHAVLITGIAYVSSISAQSARPTIATNLAFAFTLYVLLKHRQTGRGVWLAMLPAVFALWINLHFGFVMGLGLIVLFGVGDFLQRHLPMRETIPIVGQLSLLRLVGLLLLIILAMSLNPYGLGSFAEILHMIRANSASSIAEWQSPNFRDPQNLLFLLLAAVAWGAHALSPSRPSWVDLGLAATFVILTLQSQRHMPLACIALVPVIASALASCVGQTLFINRPKISGHLFASRATQDLGKASDLLNALLAASVVALTIWGLPAARQRESVELSEMLPVSAADFVIHHALRGPLLNVYHHGGYLIHRFHPDIPVFIDGRFNPFEGRIFDDYMKIMRLDPDWKTAVERYGFRLVILSAQHHPLKLALTSSGAFRTVFADQHYSVLLHTSTSRPDLPTIEDALTRPTAGK